MTFPSTAHSKWRPWSGDSPNSLAPCLHPEDKLASIINPYSSFFQWMWCFSFFWRIITAWVLNHRLTASPETRLTNHSLSPSYLIFTPSICTRLMNFNSTSSSSYCNRRLLPQGPCAGCPHAWNALPQRQYMVCAFTSCVITEVVPDHWQKTTGTPFLHHPLDFSPLNLSLTAWHIVYLLFCLLFCVLNL